MDMTDDAVVTFGKTGPAGTSFSDVGYMPVNQLTLGSNPLQLPSDSSHFFISYSGKGVQDASGHISYTSLHYELIRYTGPLASFSVDGGKATVTGASNRTVIAQGDLIKNQGNLQIAYADPGHTIIAGIAGNIDASVKIGGKTVGELDISVNHSGTDLGPAAGGFTLTGGTLHATFLPV